MSLPPAGWYPDPQSGASERWWDGAAWTMQTRAPDVTVPAEPLAEEPFTEQVVEEAREGDSLDSSEAIAESPADAHILLTEEEPRTGADPLTADAGLGAAEWPPYAVSAQDTPYGASAAPATPGYPDASPTYEPGSYAAAAYPGVTPTQPSGLTPAQTPSYPGQEAAVYGVATGAAYGVATYAQPYSAGYGVVPPAGVWRSPVDNRPLVTNMIDAVRVCFQKYAQFDGRASRPEFWYFFLAYTLAGLALAILMLVPGLNLVVLFAIFPVSLALVLPTLAVSVRRLRDAGLHWAWIFLLLVPLASIALIVLWCQPTKYP